MATAFKVSLQAEVAELADAHVCGACEVTRGGSSPPFGKSFIFNSLQPYSALRALRALLQVLIPNVYKNAWVSTHRTLAQ